MPIVNIPPRIRFALYIIGALALQLVSYAVDKAWAGDAEVRLVTNLASLLQLLAAAKTDLSGAAEDPEGRHRADEDPAAAIRARNAVKGI